MPRFFVDGVSGDTALITGGDTGHISRVLRMKEGEGLILCDCKGMDYDCEIIALSADEVRLKVLSYSPSKSEPTVKVTLYQGLPKSDKMDLIVQKSVELGVYKIVPVLSARCVSRPDNKSMSNKVERWNKIAVEAAKQSGRGILPIVAEAENFTGAIELLKNHQNAVMFYEENGGTISQVISADDADIGIFIGPEGGFDIEEVEAARRAGIKIAGMGPRILRTETAPLCALSAIMFATGNI